MIVSERVGWKKETDINYKYPQLKWVCFLWHIQSDIEGKTKFNTKKKCITIKKIIRNFH